MVNRLRAVSLGLFTWRRGTPSRWGNPLRLSNPPIHKISHFKLIFSVNRYATCYLTYLGCPCDGSRGGVWGARPPLKILFGTGPPSYLRVWMTGPTTPYLKVWIRIRHCAPPPSKQALTFERQHTRETICKAARNEGVKKKSMFFRSPRVALRREGRPLAVFFFSKGWWIYSENLWEDTTKQMLFC